MGVYKLALAWPNFKIVVFSVEPQWQAAVAAYGNALVPAENRIAGKLKSQLRNMNANTLQFLQEFKRYQELIKRPAIQRELVVERENLLGKLSEFINLEKKEYRDIGPSKMLHGIPKTINSIYFIRQLEAKVRDIVRTGDNLLHDLKSWPTLKTECNEFLEEMTEYQRELFDSWCRDNLHDIERQNLSLKTSSQVVYFEAGKDMKVSYNPRLVGLTREVRMLTMLGFAIPQKILETTDLAKKFASQAKTLDQIANFHNTIGDRMITSQVSRIALLQGWAPLSVQVLWAINWHSDTKVLSKFRKQTFSWCKHKFERLNIQSNPN